jgi:DNA-binding XRE family transcriptional regulator
MSAGQLLRQWRETRDIDQRTLARELGVTQSTISLIERDQLMPGLVLSVKIEQLTGIAPREWYR